MHAAVDRALEVTSFWDEELRSEIPQGADIFDAHTHIGDDIDGMKGRPDELVGIMDAYGVSRAFTFCMDEPDRHPGFRAPNDRTLADAERSNGRLIPFVRLDLSESPIEEARRCLELGARGIKLHPRAQRFLLDDKRLEPVFAIAAEWKVPILIHGGRGLPPIAAGLGRLYEQHPGAQLIIAHAGIADLAGLAEAFSGREGVFFDTSVWSPVDLLDFYRQVSPEQVVYASDYPYGQQPQLAADRDPHRACGRVRRCPAAGDAVREREPDRRRQEPAADDGSARQRRAHPADGLRSHPRLPVDGHLPALAPPAGHVRRPRARAQRLRGARRPGGGARTASRAAFDRPRRVADPRRNRGRG